MDAREVYERVFEENRRLRLTADATAAVYLRRGAPVAAVMTVRLDSVPAQMLERLLTMEVCDATGKNQ